MSTSAELEAKKPWQDAYDPNRKGAGYFLSQTGRLRFEPAGYIAFRGVVRAASPKLLQEWDRWLRDLGKSINTTVQKAVKGASSMTQEHLDQFYEGRVVAKRDLAALEHSAEQLSDADNELRRRVQRRRGKSDLMEEEECLDAANRRET